LTIVTGAAKGCGSGNGGVTTGAGLVAQPANRTAATRREKTFMNSKIPVQETYDTNAIANDSCLNDNGVTQHYTATGTSMNHKHLLATALIAFSGTSAIAQEQVLNIYSARHYPTDEALYSNFTKTTGIKLNRVDADDAGILARLKAEGTASPADVILLVDASRLWRGEIDGLFQPIKSKLLDDVIPAQYRGKALVRLLDPRPRHRV